mmetsp:Transcript_12705/g.44997  ORF Transcript_12705/g.44997 Transcript_12705/m.44997 type:complete len:425 (-) Transcript_12705:171-1445(-)
MRWSAMRPIEQPVAHHHPQHAPDHVVNLRIGQCGQLLVGELSLLSWIRGPRHLLVATSMGGEVPEGPPVAHDPTLETHPALQIAQQDVGVVASLLAVHEVIRTHRCSNSGIHGSNEWRVVNLPECTPVDDAVGIEAIRLLAVSDEVFHHCQDILRLDASDKGRRQPLTQVRRLTGDVLRISAAARDAVDVQTRAQQNIGTFHAKLLCDSSCPSFHQFIVPSGGNSQGRGPTRHLCQSFLRLFLNAEPLTTICKIERRNAESFINASIPNVVAWEALPLAFLAAGAPQKALLLLSRQLHEQIRNASALLARADAISLVSASATAGGPASGLTRVAAGEGPRQRGRHTSLPGELIRSAIGIRAALLPREREAPILIWCRRLSLSNLARRECPSTLQYVATYCVTERWLGASGALAFEEQHRWSCSN